MPTWDPDEALRRIEEERVTFMGAPPVFFSQMAASSSFSAEAVSSLRLVSTGGASVSPAFVEATAAAFGCRVKRTYGSTEAPTVTTSGPNDSLEAGPRHRRPRRWARPSSRCTIPTAASSLAPGEVGELWLRGPELFVGYADEALTERSLDGPGRWFRTGDLGTTDAEGWLRVMGRMSDIIIRAGENISASEVEAVLEAHPAVRCAVAVAVPDRDLGERVAAFVETSAPFDLDGCRRVVLRARRHPVQDARVRRPPGHRAVAGRRQTRPGRAAHDGGRARPLRRPARRDHQRQELIGRVRDPGGRLVGGHPVGFSLQTSS